MAWVMGVGLGPSCGSLECPERALMFENQKSWVFCEIAGKSSFHFPLPARKLVALHLLPTTWALFGPFSCVSWELSLLLVLT